MEKEKIFQQIGLNEKEAKVYMASLSASASSIAQLAKKSGLKRPNTYLVIDDLLKKQLLIKSPKGKKTLYKPATPQELHNKINQTKENFEKILPELQETYQAQNSQPKIRFYEGKQGIYQIQEEMCRAKEIWAVFSPEKFFKIFNLKDNRHFFNILIRHGGIIYDIFEDTKKARQLARLRYRTGVSEVKFFPKEMKFATDILVYDDKLALISFDNLLGTVVEDISLAQTQKLLLKFIWSHLS